MDTEIHVGLSRRFLYITLECIIYVLQRVVFFWSNKTRSRVKIREKGADFIKNYLYEFVGAPAVVLVKGIMLYPRGSDEPLSVYLSCVCTYVYRYQRVEWYAIKSREKERLVPRSFKKAGKPNIYISKGKVERERGKDGAREGRAHRRSIP